LLGRPGNLSDALELTVSEQLESEPVGERGFEALIDDHSSGVSAVHQAARQV
jgi:hypothetical protein